VTDPDDRGEPASDDAGGEASAAEASASEPLPSDASEPLSPDAAASERPVTASQQPAWVLLTPLLPWIVALPEGNWVLPFVAPLTMYPAFARRVRARRYGAAWTLAMLWAALLSVGVILLVLLRPDLADRGILHGPAYRAEMAEWIRQGVGKEVSPESFVPEHLLHLGAFLALTLVSGGYLGLVLGAFLMAYMSHFVGFFALAVGQPLTGSVVAWVPWSVIRVMAFVLLGTLLARPLLVLERRPSLWFGRREAWLFALAAAGIVTDLVLKTLLAPYWGRLLRQFLPI
jgi:hypothetical protein